MVGVTFGPKKEIASVSDVINTIKANPKNNVPEKAQLRFLYRGHSDTGYKLCPSIAREKFGLKDEIRLIEQARNKLPNEFSKNNDKLTILAKMQHYGLPTRLIDITSNPLVALYFACQNSDKDGEVIIFQDYICRSGIVINSYRSLLFPDALNTDDKESFRWLCEKISISLYSHEFIKELILYLIDAVNGDEIPVEKLLDNIYKRTWFLEWSNNNGFLKLKWEQQVLYLVALLKNPIIVEAQETLERQRIQQGMYILIPNEVVMNDNGYVVLKKIPDLNVKDSNIGHWIIRASQKKKILDELDMIGINEGFLFGDSVDHVCAYIKRLVCE